MADITPEQRRLIALQAEEQAKRLSGPLAAQLIRLAERLQFLNLLDLDLAEPDEEIELGFIADTETGEVVVAISVDDSIFWEQGKKLIEQREDEGRTLYRGIAFDGEPGDWHDAPPPPSRSQGN